ncbi:MAG: hypothetical protein JWP88_2320 [Flaviaesturariibacter sp.]|nr:hypothetical protein [Flaviaesturariibacter sp.]
MSPHPKSSLSLEEQLQLLEDLYAECLLNGEDISTLSLLWHQIKMLRQHLNLPIFLSTES